MRWLEQPDTAAVSSSAQAKIADRVLRQLVEALLYEGLVSYETEPVDSEQMDNKPVDEKSDDVIHVDKEPLHLKDSLVFRFTLIRDTFAARGKIGAFGRIRLVPASVRRLTENGGSEVTTAADIVVQLPVAQAVQEQLFDELNQTIKLSTLSLQRSTARQRNRRELGYEALESAIDEGHLYHPCFKARTGFSAGDHERYGPEAGSKFKLCWLAVRRSYFRANLPAPEADFWQKELGLETYHVLQNRMTEAGFSINDYGLIPVHPWQWQVLEDGVLQSALAQGRVRYLGVVGDNYCATQSVRTLLNCSSLFEANIKLPMDMVNTSSRRTLQSHSVCTAPAISAWLNQVVDADPYFTEQAPLVLLAEYAGLLYEAPQATSPANLPAELANETVVLPDHVAGELTGQLGAIWRESVHRHLRPGEQAIPFTALMVWESDQRPFIHPWLATFGVERWLDQLIQVVVIPVWHLLVAHGIGVEAHAQNLVLLHRNGWPERLVLRDFHESVEYEEKFLTDRAGLPNFAELNPVYREAPPDRYYWMSSVEALRELVMDTLFVYNLTELSHLLDSHYGYSETLFWHRVGRHLNCYAQAHPEHAARITLLRYDAAEVQTESLLTRKLRPGTNQEFHHLVPNPFHCVPKSNSV